LVWLFGSVLPIDRVLPRPFPALWKHKGQERLHGLFGFSFAFLWPSFVTRTRGGC
jgi:hypothetical protein